LADAFNDALAILLPLLCLTALHLPLLLFHTPLFFLLCRGRG
jgi:hypothetical protein